MDCNSADNRWQGAITEKNDFVQEMVRKCIQKAIELEFATFIGANEYERTEARRGQRNGHYDRQLNTRVGTITLHVCRDRAGDFKTEFFERYQRSEKALVLTILEMYVSGVSTRKMSRIIEALCGHSVSKSQVSDLTKQLDVTLEAWRKRLLIETYLYLVVDARYENVRENGRVTSKAFVTIIGIRADGKREVIGCYVINSESFEEWDDCFEDLQKRELKGVTYIVSDENNGLKSAIKKRFQGAEWQRCQVHFMRNFTSKLAKSELKEGIKLLKDLFAAPSKEAAIARLQPLKDFLDKQKKEHVFQWLEENIENTLAVYSLPEEHQKKMHSTNMVERLNEELKRRSRVVRIFPNKQSCLRLLSAICQEISEEWGHREYLHFY